MPIGDVLIGVAVRSRRASCISGQSAETNGSYPGSYRRERSCSEAGQRTGDGVKVAQVKRKRIALVVEAESSIGRDRGGNHVAVSAKM